MVYAATGGHEAVHEKDLQNVATEGDWIVADFERFEFITKSLCIQRAAHES